MGEIEDYIIVDLPSPCDDTRQPLLSLASGKASRGHVRSASSTYGSFSPRCSIDAGRLFYLLPPAHTPPPRAPAEKDEPTPVDPLYTPAREGAESINRTSPPDSEVADPSPDFFLTECDKEIRLVLEFVSSHLSAIEGEMNRYKERVESPVHAVAPPHGNINGEDDLPGEDDADSTGGDSGIEDDHLASPKGFLSRIRDVVLSLKSSLDTTLSQLDEMVGIYDDRTQGNSARVILSKHNYQKELLRDQLNKSLVQIDKELENLDSEEDISIKKLRLLSLKKSKTETIDCLGIISFLLLLSTISVLVTLAVCYPMDRWVIVLRLLRSPLMIVLYLYLIGFNIIGWSRANIDYITIFSFPVINGVPTPKIMFRIAGAFTLLFTFLTFVCVMADHHVLYIVDKVVALLMWSILLISLINPFNIFLRSGRFAFILVIVRILIAPFPEVKFGDFWFADQLNSVVALLLDVQYLFCYVCTADTWSSSLVPLKICTSSNNGIRPIISCLPSLWRFLQCLRCYQKTRKILHLINALKYFTTFPVIIFAAIFARKFNPSYSLSLEESLKFAQVGWVVLCWSIASVVHSLYTFLWDVVMDWGLFHGTCLRPRLRYSKWKYYVAIVFDFFIRFACALKLTLAIVYHYDSDVIYFGLIVAEILRRWVWNFFRVEYEQILLEK